LVDVQFVNISFLSDIIPDQWLSNVNIEVSEMIISNSKVMVISVNAFCSVVFENMRIFYLENTADTNFFMNNSTFFCTKRLERIKITGSRSFASLAMNAFQDLQDSLKYLEISKIAEPIDVLKILGTTEFKVIEQVTSQFMDYYNLNFSSQIFAGICGKVERIYFTDSRIMSLKNDTFENCANLITLDLKNNLLANLPLGIFKNAIKLRTIYLQNNQLTSIPNGLFMTQNIQTLNLQNNYWHCDTDILYLKQLIEKYQRNITINACTSPPIFEGVAIKDLWCEFSNCIISCKNTSHVDLPQVLEMIDPVSKRKKKIFIKILFHFII
jgi:hypothetical protein